MAAAMMMMMISKRKDQFSSYSTRSEPGVPATADFLIKANALTFQLLSQGKIIYRNGLSLDVAF